MKKVSTFVVVILLLMMGIIFAISVGSVSIPLKDIVLGIFTGETGTIGIIRTIRIPRVIMGVLVGANLSVAGVLLQGVMRNPLADPGITGISSGASVVVMAILLYFPQTAHMIPLYGFIGGMLACGMIYSLAWKNGITAVRIILAGVAVNAMLGGVSSMISILNSENLGGVLNWMNGNLGKKSWEDIRLMAVYTTVGLLLAMPMAKSCNLLALGDKTAKSLGMNPNLQRIMISIVAVFLAGISTAYAGVIGFVGLVVPHISRLLMGSDHKVLIPFSALLGALVLLMADTLGRTVAAPYEIPVGVIMAVLGGPFFLYLLRKGGDSYGS
jgi:iron complex transport system permease protein